MLDPIWLGILPGSKEYRTHVQRAAEQLRLQLSHFPNQAANAFTLAVDRLQVARKVAARGDVVDISAPIAENLIAAGVAERGQRERAQKLAWAHGLQRLCDLD